MKTLIEEKANVARLRDLLEKETDPLIKESIQFRLAKARLWHDVAECGVLTPERIKQVRRRKCRTGAIVCFVVVGIAAVMLVVSLFGCHTVSGAGTMIQGIGTDVKQIADGYIEQNR